MISYDDFKMIITVSANEQYDILRMARDIMKFRDLHSSKLDYLINELAVKVDILKELDER